MQEVNQEFLNFLMQEALIQAELAAKVQEVPVGAVVAHQNKIISVAHNEVEQLGQATRHAEVIAIERAAKVLGDWRLTECILCVTLEPCAMCIGAIKLSRLPVIVFGAHDQRLGACGSLFDLSIDSRLGPVPRVISGVEEAKSSKILKDFFKTKR